MIHVDLLGTGGTMPLPKRHLTSLMVRCLGEGILIDCGEGTQVAIRSKNLGFKHISTICITHFHADHIAGLPGLLLTIGNSDRTEPITIIGPVGLKKVVEGLLLIAPYLPFNIKYIETTGENNIYSLGNLHISAVEVEHDIFCLGYKIELTRVGRFREDFAKATGIPVKYWSLLQKGEKVIYKDVIYNPKDFTGEGRKGIKLVYTTDLRPSKIMVEFAKYADLFVCEGIYGEDEKIEKALKYKHTIFSEAAQMAKEAEVNELWLTHFSPSLVHPQEHLNIATDIFENSFIEKTKTQLNFKN